MESYVFANTARSVSHLDQDISIRCPLAQARKRLTDFFHEFGNREGDTLKLALHIDLAVPGFEAPLTVGRSVIATIQPHHLAGDMEPRYRVQWAPQTPGPFPLFSGELLVEGASDYNSFRLRLSGDYSPPLGLVGKSFDLLLGKRIAEATTSNLLHRIRDSVERAFQHDEALKPHA
jgi:hypothetical protein